MQWDRADIASKNALGLKMGDLCPNYGHLERSSTGGFRGLPWFWPYFHLLGSSGEPSPDWIQVRIFHDFQMDKTPKIIHVPWDFHKISMIFRRMVTIQLKRGPAPRLRDPTELLERLICQ